MLLDPPTIEDPRPMDQGPSGSSGPAQLAISALNKNDIDALPTYGAKVKEGEKKKESPNYPWGIYFLEAAVMPPLPSNIFGPFKNLLWTNGLLPRQRRKNGLLLKTGPIVNGIYFVA